MKKLIFFWIFILTFSFVHAREYCALGPYFCEGFDSYEKAKKGAFLGDEELTSSYSCSHRQNHYYCASCCHAGGSRFIVYDMRDCVNDNLNGTYYFQAPCTESDYKVGGVVKSGHATLRDIWISIGNKTALSKPDGSFNLSFSSKGSYPVSAIDYQKRYNPYSGILTITHPSTSLNISLTPITYEEFHVDENKNTQVIGYVRSTTLPASFYSVKLFDQTRLTSLSGYFEFAPSTSGTARIWVTDSFGIKTSHALNITSGRTNFIFITIT